MGVQVRERSIEEIEGKLASMNTILNKIMYLESALKESGFSYEIKRFLWGELAGLYAERKMYDRAAKAMGNKAAVEVTLKDKIDSHLVAAELFARMGKVDEADEMFIRASRDANVEQRSKVKLARKNIYVVFAKEFENKGKKAGATKFYEKLIKMNLDDMEKMMIKDRLLTTYKALGMFREAKLLEGI